MILRDGTDTHDECRHPGRFLNPMAVYLSARALDGYDEDESMGGADSCEHGARWGRRVLYVDDRGFVSVTRFPTVDLARGWLEELSSWVNDDNGGEPDPFPWAPVNSVDNDNDNDGGNDNE